MADSILAQPTPGRNLTGRVAEVAPGPAGLRPDAGQGTGKRVGQTAEVLKTSAVSSPPPLYQRLISYTSALLVFLLAAGAFVLSYATLWDTALHYGLPPRLAWIWPLLVDFALVVFSLAVVRASLYGEQTLWPWLMVALYTAATVAFNVLHAPDNLTARVVAVVAPVSLFLSFETLMAMLKAEVKRKQTPVAVKDGQAPWTGWQQRLDRHQAELNGQIERWQTIAEKLGQRLADLDRQLSDKQVHLAGLEIRREEVQDRFRGKELEGQAGAEPGQPQIEPASSLSLPERREQVRLLFEQGLSQPAMAAHLGVSLSTIKRDLATLQAEKKAEPRSLNGMVKVLEPLRSER